MDILQNLRVTPDVQSPLAQRDSYITDDAAPVGKSAAKKQFKTITRELDLLQQKLFAESTQSLLIILQAMDTGGKDSTIRSICGPLNPQGIRIHGFKKPTREELAHDYLWRVHHHTPADGFIGVFNRSHYEDVLVVRVHNLVPEEVWGRRYDHINAFEQRLHDEGTRIIKFYLHISPEYQKQQLRDRVETPRKQWKYNPGDLKERARWDDYMAAYTEVFRRCSPDHAPWYIIPAERKWLRNLLIATIIRDTLQEMNPHFPEPGDIIAPNWDQI